MDLIGKGAPDRPAVARAPLSRLTTSVAPTGKPCTRNIGGPMIRPAHDSPLDVARIDELEALQDDVMTELDRLNEQIEALLREHAGGRGEPSRMAS